MRNGKKQIGIIVPAYNESQNIQEFCRAVLAVIEDLSRFDWKIIFVDDGSQDNTWEVVCDQTRFDPRLSGIRLSRNFGKEVALTAGAMAIQEADALIFIDADLQHPPELIPKLLAEWEKGFQVVITKRLAIRYSLVRKIGSALFHFLINRFSEVKLEPGTTDFRLLDRKVLNVLRTFRERTRFFRGLIDWMGFRRSCVTFSAPDRTGGNSSFNLRRLVSMAIHSFTSFSLLPLQLTGILGILTLAFTSLLLSYMVMAHYILGYTMFTALAYFVVFNTLLFGVVLAGLGLVAHYIGQIHVEVIDRPLYIIQDQIGIEHTERLNADLRIPSTY
ncbi:MAG: glycosyl transferase [Nitrospinae bacterium CG11_big_fil_rev_8_21_14_0_20_56_8]|nr:MAG: glycosyl transferase [Nitrospinae bacterium CG11_big_fil_rev_8_21_14_0_20_56_8]